MEDRIKKIIASVFEIEEEKIDVSVSTETSEKWDSLSHMKLVVALEEDFGILFDNEEIIDLISFPLIKKIIEEKLRS